MSPDLPWEAFVDVMNEFAVKMWKSGNPASWRADAVKASLQKYEDMLGEEREGVEEIIRKWNSIHSMKCQYLYQFIMAIDGN